MNPEILKLVQSFKTKSKTPKKKYKDFLAYVYTTFDNKIVLCKKNGEMNKYKQMRTYFLKYVVENEKEITDKICK